MRVFVTGGTGFIGKHLVRRLTATGHEVVCLVRSTSDIRVLREAGVQIVYGDVRDYDAVVNGMAGCDRVVHLANLYEMWLPDWSEMEQVNVDGTRCVMQAAMQTGVQRVVYLSTVAVFGKPAEWPFCETSPRGLEVFSNYARSKRAAELVCREFQAKGLPVVMLYPGIVLGAGDDKPSGQYIRDIIRRRVPSTIFHQSIGTYVYVGDVVEAILQACVRNAVEGRNYLVGKHALNGREYVQLIAKLSGVSLPWFHFPDWAVIAASYLFTALSQITRTPPGWGLSIDAARTLKNGFFFDGSRAEKELGLRYTSLEAALQEAIQSYRE